uniref:Myb/SANT-like domain-containing protein n=1 Tax=Tanacetum cinerariifolium TaxID=118510 RepID=A0A6L2JBU7_TANCI|nr:myb/SANT-like domain-containing protein [Tanacetum cinerariifolium]
MLKYSGCQWNDVDKKIACECDWYLKYCENHKEAKGLWDFPFPYFNQLDLVYGMDRAIGTVVEGFKDAIHNMENEQNGKSRGDNIGGFHISLSDDEEVDVQYMSQTTQTTLNFTNGTNMAKKQKATSNGKQAAKKRKIRVMETMANGVANAMADDNNHKKDKSNQLKDVLDELMKLNIPSGDVQQENLKAVIARLNFEEVLQHSELGTPSRRRDLRKRLRSRRICSMSRSPKPRRGQPESPRKRDTKRKTVFKRLENVVFQRPKDNEKSISAHSNDPRRQSYHSSCRDTENYYQNSRSRGIEPASMKHHNKRASSHKTEALSESKGSAGGHWKSRSKKQRSSIEDDNISQPWVCEETDPFTPRIRYFDLTKRTRMPSHVQTYDESKDPEDHLKIFQAAAKVERRAMPTWCHMFNSTRTGSAKRVARQRITQSFSLDPEFSFPPLEEEERTEGPMIIEAEIGGHSYTESGGILTLRSSKIIPIECAAVSRPDGQPPATYQAIEERIKAKRRSQAADRNQAIQEEVKKLVDAGIMKEVHYHSWLSNPGYHQIKMAKEYEEKTIFITSQGVFCYSKMPFGLRNVEATYQHLVDKAFHKQIDKNLGIYVDDLVIKSHTEDKIIRDIKEIFKTLREINMKLNPKKMYLWGRRKDIPRLQGQYQRNKGMYEQSRCCCKSSISEMLKDVQKLNEKLASLNRFLAKSVHSRTSHTYTPEEKEELIVYLATTKEAVTTVLMTEMEAKKMPIYFVSCALRVERSKEDDPGTAIEVEEELTEPWIFFTDGFEATNNEAVYEALIAELRIAEEIGVKNLQANVDSRLVANQVNGTYIEKEAAMIWYLEKVNTLTNGFRMFSIKQVPRSEKTKADALSKIASTSFAHLSKQVLVEELKEKSINELEVLAVVEEEGNTWMASIYEYLTEETLPTEVNKMEEISHVFWTHRTMIKSSNVDTPFSLTYGTEAVIPVEIGMPMLRTVKVDMVQNDEALEINLDLLEEKREQAAIREAKSKAKMEKYYNSKVCSTSFKSRDLFYRNNDAIYAEKVRKLGPR